MATPELDLYEADPALIGAATGAAAILAAFGRLFVRMRREEARRLVDLLDKQYPEEPAGSLKEITRGELDREREYERKVKERLSHDLPEAFKIEDPGKRSDRINQIVERERRYLQAREDAMTSRALHAVSRHSLKRVSPEGAYWTLSPDVKKHTLDCIMLAHHFWPWEVLDELHPPLHHGCACDLISKHDAISQGLMTEADVPDTKDAIRRARDTYEWAKSIEHSAEPAEVYDYLCDLEEAYDPAKHPRDRKGRWRRTVHIRKPVAKALKGALPDVPAPPSARRDRGTWRWAGGRKVRVPEGRKFRRTIGAHTYTSPPDSTNLYRDGRLTTDEVERKMTPGALGAGGASPNLTRILSSLRPKQEVTVRAAPRGELELRSTQPLTWPEFVADTQALSEDLARRYNAPYKLSNIIYDPKVRDHAGFEDWEGNLYFGRDVLPGVEAEAERLHEGRKPTDREMELVYGTYRIQAHEASHAVNEADEAAYSMPAGYTLEEGLTEDAAHILARENLHRVGRDDVIEWAKEHPDSLHVWGTYQVAREQINDVFNTMGMPVKDRDKAILHLKFGTPPLARVNELCEMSKHYRHPLEPQEVFDLLSQETGATPATLADLRGSPGIPAFPGAVKVIYGEDGTHKVIGPFGSWDQVADQVMSLRARGVNDVKLEAGLRGGRPLNAAEQGEVVRRVTEKLVKADPGAEPYHEPDRFPPGHGDPGIEIEPFVLHAGDPRVPGTIEAAAARIAKQQVEAGDFKRTTAERHADVFGVTGEKREAFIKEMTPTEEVVRQNWEKRLREPTETNWVQRQWAWSADDLARSKVTRALDVNDKNEFFAAAESRFGPSTVIVVKPGADKTVVAQRSGVVTAVADEQARAARIEGYLYPGMSGMDLPGTLRHEYAHRIWDQLPREQKKRFADTVVKEPDTVAGDLTWYAGNTMARRDVGQRADTSLAALNKEIVEANPDTFDEVFAETFAIGTDPKYKPDDWRPWVRNSIDTMRDIVLPTEGKADLGAIDVGADVNRAADLLAQGKRVKLDQPREVTILLDKLRERTAEAKRLGKDAPTYNLCLVTVKDTNLFCAESKGIPRIKMPQLGGFPTPGSKGADPNLPEREANGYIDLTKRFHDSLVARGVKVTDTTEQAEYLRPTQMELNGAKVAGILNVVEAGKPPLGWEDRVPVSRDNYILDGHHRWAARIGEDTEDNKLGNVEVPITRIDMPITDLLEEAHKFADDWGLPDVGVADGKGKADPGVTESPPLYHVAPESAAGDIEKEGLRPRVPGQLGTMPEFPVVPGIVYAYPDEPGADRWAHSLGREDVVYRIKGIPEDRLVPDHEELDDALNQHFNFSAPDDPTLHDTLGAVDVNGEPLSSWWKLRVPRNDYGGVKSAAAVAEMPPGARAAAAKVLLAHGRRVAVDGPIGPEHLERVMTESKRIIPGTLLPTWQTAAAIYDGFEHEGLRFEVDEEESRQYSEPLPGDEVQKTRVRTTGSIFDTKTGKAVGWVERDFKQEGIKLIAYHSIFQLDPAYEEHGFASAFNKHAEEEYRKLGIDEIHLSTKWVGGYAWARAGYDFESSPYRGENGEWTTSPVDPQEQGKMLALQRVGWTDDVPERLREPAEAFNSMLQLGDFKTPAEIANYGRDAPWTLKEPLTLYGESDMDRTVIPKGTKMWLGKLFMLGTEWNGVKRLSPKVEEATTEDIGTLFDAFDLRVPPDDIWQDDDEMFWQAVDKLPDAPAAVVEAKHHEQPKRKQRGRKHPPNPEFERQHPRARGGTFAEKAGPAQPPGRTTRPTRTVALDEHGKPLGKPVQDWIDSAKLPLPPGGLTVTLGPCPTGEEGACTVPGERHIYIDPKRKTFTRYVLLHELGHVVSYEMSNGDRDRFQTIVGDTRAWRTSPNSPHEKAAEMWAQIAIYGNDYKAFRKSGGGAFGLDHLTRKQYDALRGLFTSAAGRRVPLHPRVQLP